MRYFIVLLVSFSLMLFSCHHNDGPTNEYKNAKTHASDTYSKEHKRAAKKAKKDGQKTMKEARKAQRKKQRRWGKHGSYE